jgi:hypothetical protein
MRLWETESDSSKKMIKSGKLRRHWQRTPCKAMRFSSKAGRVLWEKNWRWLRKLGKQKAVASALSRGVRPEKLTGGHFLTPHLLGAHLQDPPPTLSLSLLPLNKRADLPILTLLERKVHRKEDLAGRRPALSSCLQGFWRWLSVSLQTEN